MPIASPHLSSSAEQEQPSHPVLDRPLLLAMQIRWEIVAYVLLVMLALALRLAHLGDKPLHHDESQDAYFSWIQRAGT
ncbi:MAG: hypothetical protein M1396_02115 [Chloroflexi bacterium]|nr:hypothetical protein [Chloroflexota bacterium]